MNFGGEIWLTILSALIGAITWLVKFLQKKFEEKENELKKLREENTALKVTNARLEEHVTKKIAKSKKRPK